MPNSNVYEYKQKESFFSYFVKLHLSVFRFFYKDRLNRHLKSYTNQDKPSKIPNNFHSKFDVFVHDFGREVWIIKPKNKKTEKIVFYLHGGAYFYNILFLHWQFLYKLATKSDATFVVPNYPLAPKSNYEDSYSFVNKVYHELVEKSEAKEVIFLGDSAGGGLALGFAQILSKQEERRQPNQTILLAPWLDLEMDNPDMLSLEKYDKILDKEALKKVGEIYAKGTDTKDPLVSPIYGDFSNLKNLSFFVGGHDLFLEDVKKLKKNLENQNFGANYFFYPKMLHVWMAIPFLKEGKNAILQISELINSGVKESK